MWSRLRPPLLAIASCLFVSGCASSSPGEPEAPRRGERTTRPAGVASVAATLPSPNSPLTPRQARIFDQVASARQLGWKSRQAPTVISREEAYARIVALNEKSMPSAVMRAQGEMLRALWLIGPEDDLAERVYRLARANLAGFYDQHTDRMFLIDDLTDVMAQETLTHELVHALQDQHFDLAGRLRYRPGQSDSLSAVHGLCEGEATAATFEITAPGTSLSPSVLRLALMASLALSEAGASTPRVLQAGLAASYVDGYRFVQELRRRGGWARVDRAWQQPPQTTEQLIHVEKYLRREPALEVAPVAASAMSSGRFRVLDTAAMGEQGLRNVLEQWVHREDAARAPPGWGGDPNTLFVQDGATAKSAHLVLWQLRFDTVRDAEEVGGVLTKTFSKLCAEKPKRGAIAWRRWADRVVILARHSPGLRCSALSATLNELYPLVVR